MQFSIENIHKGEGNLFEKPHHKGMLPRCRKLYDEEEFYAQRGKPVEKFSSCSFQLNIGFCDETVEQLQKTGMTKEEYLDKYGYDCQTLFLVANSRIPYLRMITRIKGKEEPFDDSMVISPKSEYALGDDAYRESICPKIAYGLTAIMLWNAKYFDEEDYFYNPYSEWTLIHAYREMARNRFIKAHSADEYAGMGEEEMEYAFCLQHYKEETEAWEKCGPLKRFPRLYDYAESLTSRYLGWLEYK